MGFQEKSITSTTAPVRVSKTASPDWHTRRGLFPPWSIRDTRNSKTGNSPRGVALYNERTRLGDVTVEVSEGAADPRKWL
jgi:hypothetical protein